MYHRNINKKNRRKTERVASSAQEDLQRLELLLSELKNKNESIRQHLHNEYLNCLRKCQRWDEFDTYLATLPTHDTFTYSTVLDAYYDQNRYSDAEKLYNTIPKSQCTIVIATIWLKILGNQNYEQAKQFFFEQFEYSPNDVVYGTLLGIMGKWEKYDDAETLYTQIQDQANIIIHNIWLQILGQQSYERAQKFFISESFQKYRPDKVTYGILFEIMSRWEKYKEADQFYKKILDEQQANIFIQNIRLKILGKQNYERAKQFFDKISETYQPDETTNTTWLEIMGRWKKYREMKQFYKKTFKNRSENIVANNIMLKFFGRRSGASEIHPSYDTSRTTLLTTQSQTDIIACNTELKILGNQSYEQAKQFSDEILKQYPTNLVTYNILLEIMSRWGKYDEAKALYETMIEEQLANIFTKNIMLKILGEQDYEQAKQFFFDEILEQCQPDETTYNTFLEIIGQWGRYDEAKAFYKEILNKQLADIVTHNTRLKILGQRNYDQARQFFFDEILKQYQPDETTYNTFLEIISQWGRYDEAEQFYIRIPEQYRDIITFNTRLKILGKQNYERAKEFFEAIAKTLPIDKITYATLLHIMDHWEHYDEAEKLYRKIVEEQQADHVTHITMIKIYSHSGQYNAAKQLFNQIEQKTAYIYLAMAQVVLEHFSSNKASFAKNILDDCEKQMKQEPMPSYKAYYVFKKLAIYSHQLTELVMSKKKKTKTAIKLKEMLAIQTKERVAQLKECYDQYDKMQLTLIEAWLFSYYFPELDFTPFYQSISRKERIKKQKKAWTRLNHALKPLDDALSISIDVINSRGEKTGQYHVNSSTYHELTELDDYLIIKFNKPIKASKLPLFIHYKGLIYRTDILGGSKFKSKVCEGKYGSLIAVPIAAGDFFKHWFSFKESFIYGQRAFLPETQDTITKGLKGQFNVGLIPDSQEYIVLPPFIIQDGWGYIKSSAAEKMGLPQFKNCYDQIKTSYLSYQAVHSYEAARHPEVVRELFSKSQAVIIDFRNAFFQKKERLNNEACKKLYQHLTVGLPHHAGIGIPIADDGILLPATRAWENAVQGNIGFGRNPFDNKYPLQSVKKEQIAFSKDLANLASFQYTLTGYGSDAIGHFFKGMLGIIPDSLWPKEFSEQNILVSARDRKLCQSWSKASDKKTAQTCKAQLKLNGILTVKQLIPLGQPVGVSLKLAKKTAGDYDGDVYGILPLANYPQFDKMLIKSSEQFISNPKIEKTVTPHQNVNNFKKIIDSHDEATLLGGWSAVQNVFYSLSPQQKNQLAEGLVTEELMENNPLEIYLGLDWQNKLILSGNDKLAFIETEISVSLKYAQAAPKTDIPRVLLKERLHAYNKKLRELFDLSSQVSYGKSLKRGLLTYANDTQRFVDVLHQGLNAEKSYSLPHKIQRALIRLFFNERIPTKDDDAGFISEYEEDLSTQTTDEEKITKLKR